MIAERRRVPYDATRASLYRPGDAEDFFTRPGTWSDAARCAELSRLSYCNDAQRRRGSLARAGLEERAFLDVEGTEALVAVDARRAFVAFRGTDDPKALTQDAEALRVPWEKGGRVHAGFAIYLNHIRPELGALIDTLTGHELVFTGHSLGAAAATLAESLWPGATLYTFGSPRVGDPAFVSTLPVDRVHRFVDCCDLVCRLPPEDLGYVHAGELRYIDHSGVLAGDRAADEIHADQRAGRKEYLLRHALAFWKNALVRDLADHAPVNYVVAV